MMSTIKNPIDVMVVNDSPYMVEILSDLISSHDKIKVSMKARDGADALRKLKDRQPDVILVDLEMPNMDGLTFIEKAMSQYLIPIIVVSNYSQPGTRLILDFLEFGAVDYVAIPQDTREIIHELQAVLIRKIEAVAGVNPMVLMPKTVSRMKPSIQKRSGVGGVSENVIVIGASTGGPNIVSNILSQLPADLHAGVLVVQHMSKDFTASFAQRLDDESDLTVREAKEGDYIHDGIVLVAPGDYHMVVGPDKKIHLNQCAKRLGVRPSANMTMVSAAEVFGGNIIGVLLSGMGQDGAFGMKVIKKRHGRTVAQDESTSVIFGMAKAACDLNAVDKLVPANKLSITILEELETNVRE